MRATDPEYALAMKNADTAKVWQLENVFELQAEEIAIQTCFVFYSLRFSLSFTFRYSFGDIPMYL